MADLGLGEEIDRSFGDGPEHRALEQRIRSGRRALRRRRAGAAAATLAVVAAVGGAAWAVVPGDRASRGAEIATDPSPSPETSDGQWAQGETARYRRGELEVRPGVEVHQLIENPYGLAPPERSDALDLTFRGRRTWVILSRTAEGHGYSGSVPLDDYDSFEDYVAEQSGVNGDGWPELLRLAGDGAVVPTAGSEVLQRTDDPRLGPRFAPPGAATGAALVRSAEDGIGYFVIWKVVDGRLDVTTAVPRDVVGATFDELLSWARAQVASGEAGL